MLNNEENENNEIHFGIIKILLLANQVNSDQTVEEKQL